MLCLRAVPLTPPTESSASFFVMEWWLCSVHSVIINIREIRLVLIVWIHFLLFNCENVQKKSNMKKIKEEEILNCLVEWKRNWRCCCKCTYVVICYVFHYYIYIYLFDMFILHHHTVRGECWNEWMVRMLDARRVGGERERGIGGLWCWMISYDLWWYVVRSRWCVNHVVE